jgi:hypothetical protein
MLARLVWERITTMRVIQMRVLHVVALRQEHANVFLFI